MNKNSSKFYNKEYFFTSCDGYDKFGSVSLQIRFAKAIELANLKSQDIILDIGCGRGETVVASSKVAELSIGIDFSWDAVDISHSYLQTPSLNSREKVKLLRADAERLPFKDEIFDKIFFLDIIEHLSCSEVKFTLKEIFRVLKPGGLLIIHTMPNRWYFNIGYQLERIAKGLILNQKIPKNPRGRYDFLHINEQTPLSLKIYLLKAGFKSKILTLSSTPYLGNNFAIKLLSKIRLNIWPLKLIFCKHIYAVAKKS